MNARIKIGFQLAPQYGDMDVLRKRWMEAEELGADRLYTADHFHAQIINEAVMQDAAPSPATYGKNFEATTVQAAMAATTTRAEIGCLVHANSYRNPNLMADIARTIDHISGGRFILGMGAGFLQKDYEEYGYAFGTAKSRMLDFARDMPIIKARLGKLNPPPLRKMPIMIAAMGENIGMRVAAEHADIWHVYGEIDKIAEKSEVFKRLCREFGRDPADVEIAAHYYPDLLRSCDPDSLVAVGVTHIIVTKYGTDWDLGLLREVLAWRKRLA